MLKTIFLLINVAGFFLFGFFSDPSITIDHQLPATLKPGEKKEVRIIINKGSTQGFAKLDLNLPMGFIASSGETKGASFTFSMQKARFVWMSVPNTESFEVTYFIECIEGMSGSFSINGTFSYILDNRRVDFQVAPQQILVTNEEPSTAQTSSTADISVISAAAVATSQPSTAGSNNENVAIVSSNTPITGVKTEENKATTPQEEITSRSNEKQEERIKSPAAESEKVEGAIAQGADTYGKITGGKMICRRKMIRMDSTSVEVQLTIYNEGITGFCRVQEEAPQDVKIESTQDGGAVVTIDENTIKYVWFELPESPEITISYRVVGENGAGENPLINGTLSYVSENVPIEIAIIGANDNADDVAVRVVKRNPQEKKGKREIKKSPKTKEKKKEIKSEEREENYAENIATPETGVTYKVQILAAHRVVNKTYFKSRHRFNDKFNIENHEGWIKYTTGKYTEYKRARDAREKIRSEHETLPGPFVTAYNNGERITVQEALLISKQQWMQ